ncbi:MAG: hypothetical protein L0G99_17190, partial [Propionibacteriales bacterium]|nr:hypothetical protein [Propionibacteriales bacterium]
RSDPHRIASPQPTKESGPPVPPPATPTSPRPATHVRVPRQDYVVLSVALGLLGLLLGWFLPLLAGLAAGAQWAPFQDPLRLIDSLLDEHGWLRWVLAVLLPVAGVVAGIFLVAMGTTVQITDAEIVLIGEDKKRRFARAQVTRVLLEGKELVLRDRDDADLVREKLDVPVDQVMDALERHDWSPERH